LSAIGIFFDKQNAGKSIFLKNDYVKNILR
jgi:hypothetical protein